FDKLDNIESKNIPPVASIAAFFLVNFKESIPKATAVSKSEIVEVKAARPKSKKKAILNIYPPGIRRKTFGKVTKTSPAPWLGSRPKANTAVKIDTPASTAIMVSKSAIQRADFTILSSSLT